MLPQDGKLPPSAACTGNCILNIAALAGSATASTSMNSFGAAVL
jgi:hypothetical protein